jgi:acetyltransferase-like isoleucine patch superfamily enzyme
LLAKGLHQLLRAILALRRQFLDRAATAYYRVVCRKFGPRSRVGWGTWMTRPDRVEIGSDVFIARRVLLTTEDPESRLVLASGVQVNVEVNIDYTGNVTIGANTLISEGAIIYSHSHGRHSKGPAKGFAKTIGASVWIGARSIVLHGCQLIGDSAIIGAGTVVTDSLAASEVRVGAASRRVQ